MGMVATRRPLIDWLNVVQSSWLGQQASPGKHRHRGSCLGMAAASPHEAAARMSSRGRKEYSGNLKRFMVLLSCRFQDGNLSRRLKIHARPDRTRLRSPVSVEHGISIRKEKRVFPPNTLFRLSILVSFVHRRQRCIHPRTCSNSEDIAWF